MSTSHKQLRSFLLLLIMVLVSNHANGQDAEVWEEQNTLLVGRISHIEGSLLRYDPVIDDWIATNRESPFSTDDILHTEADTKTELIMPNNTWIRLDGDTQIQLATLSPETTKANLTFGIARFINKSKSTAIIASTSNGNVTAPPGAAFDLHVTDAGIEIIAIRKKVYFTHNASRIRHEVLSGSSALFADHKEVTSTDGDINTSWHNWNQQMDALWANRMRNRGESGDNLPPELRSDAYSLENHGVWERVYYDGGYYRFWRPVEVSVGWTPFSNGVWTIWHGDHVWIPHEPFGYVTHHYGNWIFTAGHWYWAPPVTRVTIQLNSPLLRIGFGWYPGRVAWINSGVYLGWITLAPHEPYYSHRHWGRRSIVVTNGRHYPMHYRKYKHHKHAVVTHRTHVYRSDNYQLTRVGNVSHNRLQKKIRISTVPSAPLFKDYRSIRKKGRIRKQHLKHKPEPVFKTRQHKQKRMKANTQHSKSKRLNALQDRKKHFERKNVVKKDRKNHSQQMKPHHRATPSRRWFPRSQPSQVRGTTNGAANRSRSSGTKHRNRY